MSHSSGFSLPSNAEAHRQLPGRGEDQASEGRARRDGTKAATPASEPATCKTNLKRTTFVRQQLASFLTGALNLKKEVDGLLLSFPGFYLKHMTAVCWEPTASGPDFSSDALSALSRCLSRGCSPTAFLFTEVTCKSFLSFIQNGAGRPSLSYLSCGPPLCPLPCPGWHFVSTSRQVKGPKRTEQVRRDWLASSQPLSPGS